MTLKATDEAWFDGNSEGLLHFGFECRTRAFVYAKDPEEAVSLAKKGKFVSYYSERLTPYEFIPWAVPDVRMKRGAA